jgi:translation initiation factor IF-2
MSLRVFELAKELNIPTKELILRIKTLKIRISGNFSVLSDEQIAIINRDFQKPAATAVPKAVSHSEEAPVKTRKRIISARKAKENQKRKDPTKKKEAAEKPKDSTEKTPLTVPVEAVKPTETERKVIRLKTEPSEESIAVITAETPPVDIETETPARPTRRRIIRAARKQEEAASESVEIPEQKTESVEKVETGEVAQKEEKGDVQDTPQPAETATAEDIETPSDAEMDDDAKPKARIQEPIRITTIIRKVKQAETSNDETSEAEKKTSRLKPVKLKADDEEETVIEYDKKTGKPLVKRDKPKSVRKGYTDVVEDIEDLEPEELEIRPLKFKAKKRIAKSGRKKDRLRKQKEVKKAKHTFNPRHKDLLVGEFITVGELASLIGIKVPEIIKTLMSIGIMATITQSIDSETAVLVAAEHGVEIKVAFQSIEEKIDQIEDQEQNLCPRPPVVTIMGHVDHGKTSLLDRIRRTNVTEDEAGGITQHIGAYHVKTDGGYITFLDTPGHEAFTAMRARGANVTDIVVLVVAADDGPRPQTVEAIDHAKAAGVEIIVAINKVDKPDANPDRTVQELMKYGLVPEEFGGDIPMIKVSAKTGDGIPKLMEMIHLQAEVMELTADPQRLAQGVVIESKIDKGRGNTATILIQTGTLQIGANYVVGTEYGRVRAMWNDKGKKIEMATPSVPVEIVGLNGLPRAGDRFNVGEDEKQVRQIATLRAEKEKARKQALQQKRKLEFLVESMGKDEQSILNLILKTDVIGSLEALSDALNRLGNEQVAIRIIRGAVGAITHNDVLLASTSDAVILGFNTRPDAMAKKAAAEENVDIRLYSIIYEVIDDIKKALEGMLEPIVREEIQGKAEILEIFNIPKVGVVAGSKVTEGKFIRDCPVRVIRDNVIIHDGKLSSLKRFKDSAKEVLSGFECGISIESFKDLRVGDELESYLRLETAAKL